MNNSMKRPSSWLWPALGGGGVAWPVAGHAQAGDIDPDALALLRKSTDYLVATKQFSLVTDTTIEAVLADGQKLQFGHRVAVTVQRPNKMRAERVGELIAQTFYYDGKTLSLNLPQQKYYATADVPPTLDGMLDVARDKLNVIAPGADLRLHERVRAVDRRPDLGLRRRQGRRRRGRLATTSRSAMPRSTGRSGSRRAPSLCRASSSSRRSECLGRRNSPRSCRTGRWRPR